MREPESMERQYYSQRMGLTNTGKIDLDHLKKIFKTVYDTLFNKDYFSENIGYYTTNYNGFSDFSEGNLGTREDINNLLVLKLRKDNLWPIYSYIEKYSEDDLFDIIEFCFDNLNDALAKNEFRKMLNPHLKDYDKGFTLNEKGCIIINPEYGLKQILEAKIVSEDDKITIPLELAVEKFRNRNSSFEDKREAVRKLADVLEYLRPSIKETMLFTQDEKDIFNIANNFNIRHNNESQKADYDGIWLNWIFYLFLSTIHAMSRIIKRFNEKKGA